MRIGRRTRSYSLPWNGAREFMAFGADAGKSCRDVSVDDFYGYSGECFALAQGLNLCVGRSQGCLPYEHGESSNGGYSAEEFYEFKHTVIPCGGCRLSGETPQSSHGVLTEDMR